MTARRRPATEFRWTDIKTWNLRLVRRVLGFVVLVTLAVQAALWWYSHGVQTFRRGVVETSIDSLEVHRRKGTP